MNPSTHDEDNFGDDEDHDENPNEIQVTFIISSKPFVRCHIA